MVKKYGSYNLFVNFRLKCVFLLLNLFFVLYNFFISHDCEPPLDGKKKLKKKTIDFFETQFCNYLYCV